MAAARVVLVAGLLFWVVAIAGTVSFQGSAAAAVQQQQNKNAYAAMMYMGTPRDYEFYVATRVMIRSLKRVRAQADLVVIASMDVPRRWVLTLENEDGVKVHRVSNLNNPYKTNDNFDDRFKLTMNKLYAWSLIEYERVVMLDADNLFLQNTDELFQCGQFCAVFINPCIFHTGLFVLQPSTEVFKDMLHELDIGRPNPDGADQGFLGGYFPDLLDKPMFHPTTKNLTDRLNGYYRLPLGYQMDASYYYLKLRWNVPCGPNSVITFPSAVYLKPWYWWSYPVLPLGFQWHEHRRTTIGYSSEIPITIIQSAFYLGIITLTRLARPGLSKLCYRQQSSDRIISIYHTSLKSLAFLSILAAYVIPFFIIPKTVHPIGGWSLYLLGSFALCSVVVNSFLLPLSAVIMPWIGIFGVLIVMAFPWYSDGVVRALVVFGYAFCAAPFLWISINRVLACLHVSLEREAFLPPNRLSSGSDSSQQTPILNNNKLY